MHRTRNALGLLTAAATLCGCLSGCVSVEARPTPTEPPPPSPRRQGEVAPRIVQAPAREALSTILPPDTPSPPPPARAPRAAPPDPARHEHHRRAQQPHPPSAAPGKHRPHPAAPPAAGDVCALGRSYGGWRDDSPEARICHDAYGN
ncbi:hypothetical protein DT019_04180 [Streptomyces sp. SDr-06]|uniref:hypothetical protein n=1 Tax=Streptomyces sp. SDr-06 TaxID=2267702 RepID=UPI000DE895CC|nr:hypothetical protein [Streptomyces sp. SDr-06]RCH70694.1 hypothetical protein DT019_04180 [Streptomyces sp. SDr-06]